MWTSLVDGQTATWLRAPFQAWQEIPFVDESLWRVTDEDAIFAMRCKLSNPAGNLPSFASPATRRPIESARASTGTAFSICPRPFA